MLCEYYLNINATIFPAKLLYVFLHALVGAFLTNFGYCFRANQSIFTTFICTKSMKHSGQKIDLVLLSQK